MGLNPTCCAIDASIEGMVGQLHEEKTKASTAEGLSDSFSRTALVQAVPRSGPCCSNASAREARPLRPRQVSAGMQNRRLPVCEALRNREKRLNCSG